MRRLFLKAPVCLSSLLRFLIFLLLSRRTGSRALSGSLLWSLPSPTASPPPPPQCPPFPVRTWLFQPESNYSSVKKKKKKISKGLRPQPRAGSVGGLRGRDVGDFLPHKHILGGLIPLVFSVYLASEWEVLGSSVAGANKFILGWWWW